MAEAVRRRLAWIAERGSGDVAGVSAAVGGAAGVATGLLVSGLDLAVVSAAAGLGTGVAGGLGFAAWTVCRPLRSAPASSATKEPRAEPPRVFSDRVPAVPRVFVGRDELVAQLAQLVEGGGTRVLSQAIQGLGGVGKTTAAAAVAEAVRDRVAVVWWIRSEEPAVLVADMAELAGRLGLPDQDDLAETARSARRWLEETDQRWLVVFDNVPGPAALEDWLPRRGRGAALITSRSTEMHRLADVTEVGTLPPDVAERFLREQVASPDRRGDASGVVERLGGLPLALEQAAAWVARAPNRTFAQFAAVFDDLAKEPFEDGTRPIGYEHTATTTWRVSIKAANKESALAGPLLEALSFLAPEPLPCAWLRAQAGHDYLNGADAIDTALTALHAYALITLTPDGLPGLGDTVTVHRVIQAATRRTASSDAAGFAIDVPHAVVVGTKPSDPPHWPLLAAVVPHALSAAGTTAGALPGHALSLCKLLNAVQAYEYHIGAARDSVAVAVLAKDLGAAHLSEDHPTVLVSRSNLANAYEQAGDPHRAMAIHESVLTDRERVLGDDHADTLITRSSLAHACLKSGDVDRAISLYERTLVDSERVLGHDHPDTLIIRDCLAFAYRTAGDFERSLPLCESVLVDLERVLGDDHPDTLTSRNNLAGAYEEAGDLARAVALYEANLRDLERVLGPEHPNTIAGRANLEEAREAMHRE